jgi:plastocyanin
VTRAERWLLLLAVLGVTGAAFAAIASAKTSRHRPAHAGRICHRKHHRRCRSKGSAKRSGHAHKPSADSKRSTPNGAQGSTAPASAAPSPTGGTGALPAAPSGEAPPVESPAAPIAPAHLEVTAEDTTGFHFVLSRPTVPAGKVIIEFVNHGQDEHNLNALEPTAGSIVGSLPNTAPSAHPRLTVNLRHGSYVLFCSLAGHEAKGMKATLVVE